MKRRFELTDGSSNKFWEVETRGSELTVCYGRIGTAGQTKTKMLGSAAAASKEAKKLIGAKTKKGYAESSAGAAKKAATKKAATKKAATKKAATKKAATKKAATKKAATKKASKKKTGKQPVAPPSPATLKHAVVQDVLTVIPEGRELPDLLGRFIVWASELGDDEMFDELGIEGFTAEAYEDDSLADEVVNQADAVTCSFITLGEGSRITLWWHDDGPPAVILIDSEGQDEVLADSLERFLLNWSRRKSGADDLDCDEDGDTRSKSTELVAWLKTEGVKAPPARKVPDFLRWRDALGGGKTKQTPCALTPQKPPKDLAERLMACLGLLQTEEPLQSLLHELGIDMSKSRTTDQLRNLSVPEFGYSLRFEKPKEWRSPHGDYVVGDKAALVNGKARMLVGAEFCQEGHKSWNNGKGDYDIFTRFEPPLPLGVAFSDTAAKVDKKGVKDGARLGEFVRCGVMRVQDDDHDRAIAAGKIKYVFIALYDHAMYRRRHWWSTEALVAGIRAKSPDFAETIYDGWDARDEGSRKQLASLDPKDLAQLASLDLRCWAHLAEAAWRAQEEGAIADALALYDAVVASPIEGESSWVGVQATYTLYVKLASGAADRKRARAYLERYLPLGDDNTTVLLNLAHLQNMGLNDLDGAIETLRRAVLLGDPQIQAQLDPGDEDFVLLQDKPAYKALLSLQPEYPVGLRSLKKWHLAGDGAIVKGLREAGLGPLHGTLGKGVAKLFKGAKDKQFAVFAGAGEGGVWALWRRDPKASASEHAFVVVRKGRMAVYAADLAGFMALLACGYTFDQALDAGFAHGAKSWRRPTKLPSLGVQKKLKARLKKVEAMDKAGAKVDPTEARDSALKLTAELRSLVGG